jgi:hypothetical protein
VLFNAIEVFGLPDNALLGLSEFAKYALVWWLLVECSIAAVSISKEVALSGVLIVAVVIPVLLGAYFIGTWAGNIFWEVINGENLVQAYMHSKWMSIHINQNFLGQKMHTVVNNVFQGLMVAIPIWILYKGNTKLMESRRVGGILACPPI